MKCRPILVTVLLAVSVPLCVSALMGCSSADDLQDKLTGSTVPVIQLLSPAKGRVGTAVAVRGTHFGATPGQLAFQDPITARFATAQVSSWSDDVIVASVPTMDSATGVLRVGLRTATNQVPPTPALFELVAN